MNQQNKEFQALIGHLVDLYKIANFKFSNPHSYTKFRSIVATRNKVSAKAFIETGTYLGVTTKRCASYFDKVYTIELDKELAKKAEDFLKPQKNVHVYQGDALNVLPLILKEDISDTLIFLDGHFSGGETACGSMPEPVIEEIEIIANFKEKVKAIIIDDFRLFGTEPGFPSKSSLFQKIEENLPEFSISVYLDQVILTKVNV
jgi:Ribosomal RNA adenine dimethylase